MIAKLIEWWRFRRQIKNLVASAIDIASAHPELSGKPLYRAALIAASALDPLEANQIIERAESSLDPWTNPEGGELKFRDVVHYFVLTQHLTQRGQGVRIALGRLSCSLVPSDL